MSLLLALVGYGYICFDGYGVALRMRALWRRDAVLCWRFQHDLGWLCLEYGVDAFLMGLALTLALTHTLR